MKTPENKVLRFSFLLLVLELFTLVTLAADPLPDAEAVTRRMISHSQALAGSTNAPQFTYTKRSLQVQFDADGLATRTNEKIYQVTLIGGLPLNRMVQLQGRKLNDAQQKKEQEKEDRFRQKLVATDAKSLAARREGLVTLELLERYRFVVKERVRMEGRPTLVLDFQPRPGKLPAKAIHDKILNTMAGTVWVDEQEAEAVKLTAHNLGTVSIGWLGVLGALTQCELTLERKRLAEGIWTNWKQDLRIHCRKVATTMRFRILEDSTGFKQVPSGEGAN
jgi:hypothetical protein